MKHENVLNMFARHAAQTPDAAAVEQGDRRVAYGELDDASNRLANLLLASGLAPASPVAILIEDPVAAVASILGVLKAGCAFVPLEVSAPAPRLAALVELVNPAWVVAEARHVPLAGHITPAGREVNVVLADAAGLTAEPAPHLRLLPPFAAHADARPPLVVHGADDFCYVYFTSGSTGRPKAIAGRLKGIDHFIRWELETLNLAVGTRVSQFLPHSFDGSLRDIFVPLCAGGTVCVPPDRETLLDPPRLAAWIDERRIEVIHCVPSLFRSLLNAELGPELFRDLRYILMAGEPLLPADVKRWSEVFQDRVQLVNLYGTSETTMAKFIYFVRPEDAERRAIPVGKPMKGAAAVVVDARGRPCAPGVIGEIYIRTPYRSLGYYNQPELTRESFIPNPFSDDPSDIVYKTGDLGRVMEDGNYEYLGRLDQQVKVRGMRVELEEVESLLRGHEAVRDVAVTDKEDAGGFKYLCAYVVTDEPGADAELRRYAAARLPDYMVPSFFVLLDELPRTISGKVDRRALAARRDERPAAEYVAPRTPAEEAVAAAFAEVLGLPRVGALDNFFHLGGHSLSATRVVSRLRAAAEAEVALRDLFEAPTPAALAARIGSGVSRPRPIERRPEGEAPLSYAQQRLWFIDQLEPDTAIYNLTTAVRMSGPLDVTALARTLSEISRRHESLRTRFVERGGEPAQVVSPPAPMLLPVVDLSTLGEDARERELRRVVAWENGRGFDLARGPVWRAVLVRLAGDEHALVVVIHHIVSDGWSMGVLVSEVAALYAAFSQGRPSPLAELPVQYADFAAWQREHLQGETLERQLSYWRAQLAGAPPSLELPTDRPRTQMTSYRGGLESFRVGAAAANRLRELAREENVTLYMVLLAAFKTFLMRYTGREDVVVGSPIANRNLAEVEPLVGFFVNNLVLRADLSGDPTFRELLGRVRETALGAYAHQDVPFERLVEELQPERDLSRHPLFQVVFVLQNAPMERVELPGLALAELGTDASVARFDLNLHLGEVGEELAGNLYYNTDLFGAETARRMVGHFGRLLEGAAEQPEARLMSLPLLSDDERRRILFDWNQTRVDYDADSCLHEIVEAQAARQPEATAVIFEDEQLTYRELNERSNRLARHLRALGVGAETVVGLYLEPCLETVVGVHGIHKAGGAYVNLDPSLPAERLAYMIEDSGARVVLTKAGMSTGLAARGAELSARGVHVIRLDEDWPHIAQQSPENVGAAVASDNMAYVIYTSGSTGRPKGVANGHRQVFCYLRGISERLHLLPGVGYAMVQSLSVDASITYLFAAHYMGGVLHVISKERGADPEALGEYFRRQPIDFFKAAPSHLAALQASPHPEQVLPRRLMLIGGEAFRRDWALRMRDFARGCLLVNHYGPTETTVGVLTYEVGAETRVHDCVNLPLGRPLAHAEIYVLDSRLEPTPVGVAGELYIGGPSLARGYYDRPALTAERFVPHPFAPGPGARLYQTGDLARFLPDGNVEFLGRTDHQVKVRGYRVELEEIEATLGAHPAVRTAAVVARESAPGENRLTAYVAPGLGHAMTPEALRRFLQERLPEYMVPSAFVLLDELPLTPTGKVDRRALHSVEVPAGASPETYAAPRTPTEETLAGIWSQLLGLARVGIHDNFFESGGHSLTATRLVSHLRAAFGVEVPLRAFFEAQTIAEQAEVVDQLTARGPAAEEQRPAITPVPRQARRAVRRDLPETV